MRNTPTKEEFFPRRGFAAVEAATAATGTWPDLTQGARQSSLSQVRMRSHAPSPTLPHTLCGVGGRVEQFGVHGCILGRKTGRAAGAASAQR